MPDWTPGTGEARAYAKRMVQGWQVFRRGLEIRDLERIVRLCDAELAASRTDHMESLWGRLRTFAAEELGRRTA